MAPSSIQGDLLSDDVLVEIFVLLPADSLVRFRFVCKYWFNLITSNIHDPRFVEKHTHIHHHHLCNINATPTDHIPTILCTNSSMKPFPNHKLYSLNNNKEKDAAIKEIVYPFKSRSSQLQILGSCNGLLCIQVTEYNINDYTFTNCYQNGMIDYTKCILCLWNPSTNEFKQVPGTSSVEKPEFFKQVSIVMYGFGYDRFINDYKLVRLVRFSSNINDIHVIGSYQYSHVSYEYSDVKVYTLGTNSWKRVDKEIPYGSLLHLWKKVGLYVNGVLHWINRNGNIILAFNIEDEEFKEVPIPEFSDDEVMYEAELQVLRGCLCMFNSYFGLNEVCFGVWMMMDYGVKESWTKLFRVRTLVLRLCINLKPLWIYKNGEVLIGNSTEDQFPKHLVIYDLDHNVSELIGPQGIRFNWTNSIVHVGSLVSLKSGTYVDQEEQQTRYFKKKEVTIQKSPYLFDI